jgi:serine/threonine protein kinase
MERVKQNILLNSAGHARLSDIGFARLIPTEESKFDWASGGADGCRWAAPEVFQNGKLTKQSDVFSFGFISAEVRTLNYVHL